MGAWFSSNTLANEEIKASAKVLPEPITKVENKIPIRHRPTCLSTDLETGITEAQENVLLHDTKSS